MRLALLLLSVFPLLAFGQIEVRDASNHPQPGYEEDEYEFDGATRKVYVGPDRLLESSDFEDAYLSIIGSEQDGNKSIPIYGVTLVMTDEAGRDFERLSSERIKQHIAFIVDGEIVSVPILVSPLSKRLMILVDDDAQGKALLQRITANINP